MSRSPGLKQVSARALRSLALTRLDLDHHKTHNNKDRHDRPLPRYQTAFHILRTPLKRFDARIHHCTARIRTLFSSGCDYRVRIMI